MNLSEMPAFPLPVHKLRFDTTPEDIRAARCGGMTFRQYAAVEAMNGLLAYHGQGLASDLIANYAIQRADEIIKQLGRLD